MTSPRPQQIAPGNLCWRLILTGCLAPVLAACSGAVADPQLPPKPAAQHPAAIAPLAVTPRQRVVAALTGYTSALSRADRSRSKRVAGRLMRPYLAASRIGGLVAAMSAIWARGDSFYGQDVLHISTVTVRGRRAFVRDCDDTSAMGLENSATGQAVPGTAGVAHDNLITRLDLVRGHWIVDFQLVEDVPCTR